MILHAVFDRADEAAAFYKRFNHTAVKLAYDGTLRTHGG